jgi:hypothetical protein
MYVCIVWMRFSVFIFLYINMCAFYAARDTVIQVCMPARTHCTHIHTFPGSISGICLMRFSVFYLYLYTYTCVPSMLLETLSFRYAPRLPCTSMYYARVYLWHLLNEIFCFCFLIHTHVCLLSESSCYHSGVHTCLSCPCVLPTSMHSMRDFQRTSKHIQARQLRIFLYNSVLDICQVVMRVHVDMRGGSFF